MGFINTRFTFDGVDSNDMGVMICSVSDGLLERNFGTDNEVVEDYNDYTSKTYFHRIKKNNINFSITLCLMDEEDRLDYQTKNKLAKWLMQDKYKAFTSEEYPEIVYYVKFKKCTQYDTHMQQGYITLEAQCDAPHAWSNPIISEFDLSDISASTTKGILLRNMSNVKDYYFVDKMEIEFTNANNFTLTNLSDNGNIFKFTNVNIGEKLIINNELRRIESNINNVYRFNNFNGNWLRLVYGENNCTATGGVKIRITYQYPISI